MLNVHFFPKADVQAPQKLLKLGAANGSKADTSIARYYVFQHDKKRLVTYETE